MLKLVEEERSLLTIIRTRQRNCMGHNNDRGLTSKRNNRRENGLLIRKEKTKNKKLLDWMMSEEYSKLKEEAQHREIWSHWGSGPARGQRA